MSNNANQQPDELNALNKLVEQFIKRLNAIESNVDLLKEEKKELLQEYKNRLDVKTLSAAMRVAKIRRTSSDLHQLDCFVEILEKY
jgi:uncharacterized protein (UPF0335 family)